MANNHNGVIKNAKCYCCEPIENIEGYSDMIASHEKWCVHHRREITEGKSKQQLIDEGLYYNRPSNELIFMTASEHNSLHNKGEKHPMFGKHFSEEHRKKIAEANKGRVVSEKTRRKISEATKGRIPWDKGIKRDDIAGEKNPMFGKRHSEESKKKMSESIKGEKNPWFGKHRSEETRQKMSESLKGLMVGVKHPRARAVVQLTFDGQFIREWLYARQAEIEGFESCLISACCRGKRNSHKGYKWMYADEYYTKQEQQKPIIIQLDLFIHNVS